MRNHVFEAIGGCFIEALEQVSVDIKDGPNRRVTKSGCDGLRVLSGVDQERNVTVPEVVETAWLSDRSAHSGQPLPLPEVCPSQWTTLIRREDEAI